MAGSDSRKYALLDQLADEFAARYRRGERPSLKEYIDRHPDLAHDIRELFPALVQVEQAEGQLLEPATPTPLRQVGDYRILREVGRGGMGVVYEAEQLSLGRRVALKVLPPGAMKDDRARERFRREARAAAQLHHTNIVPVFEVGRDGDVCFYAMQFIPGQPLDEVIDELRRLGAASPGDAPRGRPLLRQAAESLRTGRFAAPDLTTPAAPPDGGPPPPPRSSGAAAPPGPASPAAGDADRRPFFRSVARIGHQAAQALAHAHQRGVIHRDIKPSNLLLDADGVVWVTDFGLAKTEEEGLTNAGDILGTFRYMSPERFQGQCDARADVYSLGLTLYEMLALRPAFESTDRAQLIEQIRTKDPVRPRALDRSIPRDLETVVLKGIEKEPARRYPTADEMARDLQRFLDDLPIKARRASGLEHAGRWCRRNPVVATLTAAVLLLVGVVAVGSTIAALWLSQTLGNEKLATTEANDRLWDSQLSQARAQRWSGRPGRRFDSLEALRRAAALRPALELRNEAIACLALLDVRPDSTWQRTMSVKYGVVFDSRLERCALLDADNGVTVHSLPDDRELARLVPKGENPALLAFSPGGRFLLVAVVNPAEPARHGPWFEVWDWARGERLAVVPDLANSHVAVDFSPDERWLAVGGADRLVHLFETETGRDVRQIPVGLSPTCVCFHPDGQRLAVSQKNFTSVEVHEVAGGALEQRLVSPSVPMALGWSPDGALFAAGCADWKVYVWDAPTGRRLADLVGHQAEVTRLAFSHAGDVLATSSWDATTRLWDPTSGRLHCTVPGLAQWFSADDGRLAYLHNHPMRAGVYEVAPGHECRILQGHRQYKGPRDVDFSPDGRLLASAGHDGVRLWDSASGRSLGHLPVMTQSVAFARDGRKLFAAGQALYEWPVSAEEGGDGLAIGQVRETKALLDRPFNIWALCRRGPRPAVVAMSAGGGGGVLKYLEGPDVAVELAELPPTGSLHPELSADGRWLVASGWPQMWTRVYDARTGELVKDIPTTGNVGLSAFTPDSAWMLATTVQGGRFLRPGTWEPGRQLPVHSSGPGANPWAFSPDGKHLAVARFNQTVQLLDAVTLDERATLEPSQSGPITTINFSPDGRYLAASCGTRLVQLWNLHLVRRRLAEMGLDWDSVPPPADAPGESRSVTVRIEADSRLARIRADQFIAEAQRQSEGRRTAAAIQAYEQAIAADPSYAAPQNNLAWLLATGPKELRNLTRAVKLARRATELAPEEFIYHNTLGVALYRAGELQSAVAALEVSRQKPKADSADAFNLFFLAMCHHRLGDARKAKECRDRAAAWVDERRDQLSAVWARELQEFQAEADAVLRQPAGGKPKP